MLFSLEELQSGTDENLERLVRTRARMLEEQNKEDRKQIIPNERSYEYGSYYDGFIKKDVRIYSSLGSNVEGYFCLDSDDYLVEFFKKLKREGITDCQQAVLRISEFLDEYFGVVDNSEDLREKTILKTKEHSLDALRGKGIAKCSERAALTNNILCMLGYNSIYVTGSVSTDTVSALHAYNVVQNSKGDWLLVDATCVFGVYDENKRELPETRTYFCKINNPETFLTIESSETAEVAFVDGYAIKNINGEIRLVKNGKYKKYGIEALPEEIVNKRKAKA